MVDMITQLGERLRKWRENQNISQQQLASQLGIGIATLQRWELGKSTPDDRHRAMVEKMLTNNLFSEPNVFLRKLRELIMPSIIDPHHFEIDENLLRIISQAKKKKTNNIWSDEGQIMPPIPRSDAEKALIRKATLEIKIDQELLDLFLEERDMRGLTEARLLETILWHRYGQPDLSFRKIKSDDDSTGRKFPSHQGSNTGEEDRNININGDCDCLSDSEHAENCDHSVRTHPECNEVKVEE